MLFGKPITAAAAQVNVSKTRGRIQEEDWQQRAWRTYNELGSVFFMTRYRQNVARRIDYFVARTVPGGDPEPEEGPATKILETEGGPELMRRVASEFITHWDVPGEGYLVRFDEEPMWRVLSTQEVIKKTNGITVWQDQNGQERGQLDPDAVFRVWKPHPRNHWEADSPTRHILDDAEALILQAREVRARSQSRLPAGILWIPDTIDLRPFAVPDPNGIIEGLGEVDDFARMLTDRMSRPLRDVGSADSLVPWVITAHKDDIAGVVHQTFARDWETSIELRQELLRSIATGLDLPPEIITGMADLNHWQAWLVSEAAVSQHVAPTIDDLLDSLTTGWFRPLLEVAGVDPTGILIWRDLSPATTTPDRTEAALRLYELGAISGKAVRRVTNFDEGDAPGPEEQTPAQPVVVEPLPNRSAPPPPIIAAGGVAPGEQLARLDAETLVWLIDQSEAQLELFLSKAEGLVADLESDALVGLDRFLSKVRNRLTVVQDASRRIWSRLMGRSVARSVLEDQALDQAVTMLDGVMKEGLRNALFTPDATPDPAFLGELGEGRLAGGKMRDVMDVAGGGASGDGGMIANGPHLVNQAEAAGIRTGGFRWDYTLAPRQQNFEPHLALDGMTFTRWDDPRLESHSFVGGFYRPGDHRGCLCVVVREDFCQVGLTAAASPLPMCGDGSPVFDHERLLIDAAAIGPYEHSYGGGDPWLGRLYERNGYNALGEVVSKADFAALPGETYRRGIMNGYGGSAKKYAEDLRSGDYFPGTGIHGNGTYSAYGPKSLDIADHYAGGDIGVVVNYKLKPTARIIETGKLKDLQAEFMQGLADLDARDTSLLVSDSITDAEYYLRKAARDQLSNVAMDEGRFATMMEYDAIQVPKDSFLVLLNRSVAIFEEA